MLIVFLQLLLQKLKNLLFAEPDVVHPALRSSYLNVRFPLKADSEQKAANDRISIFVNSVI